MASGAGSRLLSCVTPRKLNFLCPCFLSCNHNTHHIRYLRSLKSLCPHDGCSINISYFIMFTAPMYKFRFIILQSLKQQQTKTTVISGKCLTSSSRCSYASLPCQHSHYYTQFQSTCYNPLCAFMSHIVVSTP